MRRNGVVAAICAAAIIWGTALGADERDGGDARPADETGMMHAVWEVEVRVAETGRPAIDSQIREWLETRVAAAVRDAAGCVSADPHAPQGRWGLWGEAEVVEELPGALSVVYTLSCYPLGAAHPSSAVASLNFSLPAGRRLGLADLFERPDRALELLAREAPDRVLAALRRDCPELFEGDDALGHDAFFTEGFAAEAGNYAEISLQADALVVHFQEYQILPYVFGRPEAVIPLAALAEAGPKPEIWGRRAE